MNKLLSSITIGFTFYLPIAILSELRPWNSWEWWVFGVPFAIAIVWYDLAHENKNVN